MIQIATELGADLFARQMCALQRRPDQQSALRLIKVPTLILCGAYDTLIPVRKHAFVADLIPGAELLVLDAAGHFPTLEAPGAVSEAMLKWLQVPLRLI